MGKELSYVPMGAIFSKVSRDLGIDDFSESDVVEWAAEALDAIDAVTMLEECVYFAEVKNHQAELPPFSKAIIQIAQYNEIGEQEIGYNEGQQEYFNTLYPAQIAASMCDSTCTCSNEPKNTCGACDTAKYIPVDPVTGYPIFDEDLYVWKPYINVQAEYINWTACDWYKQKWIPVRLATSSFFNSVVCEEKGAEDLYSKGQNEYTIVGNKTIRTSFQEGFIAISYVRPVIGEDNYPMIPDHYAYTTAVMQYVAMKLFGRMWYLGREGYERKFLKAEADWQWYCKQAGNRAMMPQGIDAFQNMLDASQYLLPRRFRYNQFFKDLASPENRRFNDPDYRNNNY